MALFGFNFGDTTTKAVEKLGVTYFSKDENMVKATSEFLKAIDTNGSMRRNISRNVVNMVKLFIFLYVALIMVRFFGFATPESVQIAIQDLKDISVPVFSAFGAIVTASFAVNLMNTYKGK